MRQEPTETTASDQKTQEFLRLLRRDIIEMARHTGHVGVALSCVDILAALYTRVLNCRPESMSDLARDRFVMSKGHGVMALYAVLARTGFLDSRLLETYGHNGSMLGIHPLFGKVPGLECATGTLGHGLAIGAGMARGLKIQGVAARVFVLLGDGECNEGSVWEAAGLAAAGRLDNLVAIVDGNGLQACGRCDDISPGFSPPESWHGFGWEVDEIDGHDYDGLVNLLGRSSSSGRPRVVLCQTVKGRGIDFMEHDLEWHYRPLGGDDLDKALRSLDDA